MSLAPAAHNNAAAVCLKWCGVRPLVFGPPPPPQSWLALDSAPRRQVVYVPPLPNAPQSNRSWVAGGEPDSCSTGSRCPLHSSAAVHQLQAFLRMRRSRKSCASWGPTTTARLRPPFGVGLRTSRPSTSTTGWRTHTRLAGRSTSPTIIPATSERRPPVPNRSSKTKRS